MGGGGLATLTSYATRTCWTWLYLPGICIAVASSSLKHTGHEDLSAGTWKGQYQPWDREWWEGEFRNMSSLLYQNMLDLTTPTCPESAPALPQAPKPEDVFQPGRVCYYQTHPWTMQKPRGSNVSKMGDWYIPVSWRPSNVYADSTARTFETLKCKKRRKKRRGACVWDDVCECCAHIMIAITRRRTGKKN